MGETRDLPPPPSPSPAWDALSAREQEVLRLMMAGLGVEAIADTLGTGLSTVRTQIRGVLRKLGVHSLAGGNLTRLSQQLGAQTRTLSGAVTVSWLPWPRGREAGGRTTKASRSRPNAVRTIEPPG